jgi:hypothetical protein
MPSRFAGLNWLRVVASRVLGWSTIRRLDEDFQQELAAVGVGGSEHVSELDGPRATARLAV